MSLSLRLFNCIVLLLQNRQRNVNCRFNRETCYIFSFYFSLNSTNVSNTSINVDYKQCLWRNKWIFMYYYSWGSWPWLSINTLAGHDNHIHVQLQPTQPQTIDECDSIHLWCIEMKRTHAVILVRTYSKYKYYLYRLDLDDFMSMDLNYRSRGCCCWCQRCYRNACLPHSHWRIQLTPINFPPLFTNPQFHKYGINRNCVIIWCN